MSRPLQPPPFARVEPLAPLLERPPGHERFGGHGAFTGTMLLEIRTHRPLHVGDGGITLTPKDEEVLYTAFVAAGAGPRTPVLPGSSFKGAVRAVAEAISPSCLRVGEGPTRREDGEGERGKPAGPCRPGKESLRLCPACRIFGAPGYLGHVVFSDVPFRAEDLTHVRVPVPWTPRRAHEGRKLYHHSRPSGRGELREAVREGAKAQASIHFRRLRREDLGLLAAALGNDRERLFLLKLGGGKPFGLGSVEVRIVTLTFVPERPWRLGRGGQAWYGEKLTTFLHDCLQAARKTKILNEDRLQRVAEILDEDRLHEPAPDGAY